MIEKQLKYKKNTLADIISVTMYQYDSRQIKPSDIYICLPGGEAYIPEALEKGASSYIAADRKKMADLANTYYDNPSKKLCVIGITGTNGKTTVAHLVGQALKKAGFNSYVQGTLTGKLTTPESLDTIRAMSEHLKNKGTHFIMEVSSHAIAQDRIAGITFHAKLLTNITQDHLDYHKTFEAYAETKLSFMNDKKPNRFLPEITEITPLPFPSPLPGVFNYKNMQAAVQILASCGLNETQIQDALSNATSPPGRFETIDEGQQFKVIVDYAHTPDGLQNVLQEAQVLAEKTHGKVRVLFGCGGERDKTKRPKMGSIAHQYADHLVITQDNPRSEDPTKIIEEILEGIPQTEKPYEIILDRKQAIQHIINLAQNSDIVMIVGKGHETHQIINGKTLPFDDREEARIALKLKRKS